MEYAKHIYPFGYCHKDDVVTMPSTWPVSTDEILVISARDLPYHGATISSFLGCADEELYVSVRQDDTVIPRGVGMDFAKVLIRLGAETNYALSA